MQVVARLEVPVERRDVEIPALDRAVLEPREPRIEDVVKHLLDPEEIRGARVVAPGDPEQADTRQDIDIRSDIYALGATLHHILSRRDPRMEPPFSFAERPLRKINPNVSIELETVINTALQYNVEDRFKSIEDFKEELNKTGVISEEYKTKLLSMVMAVSSEAYHAGQDAVKYG